MTEVRGCGEARGRKASIGDHDAHVSRNEHRQPRLRVDQVGAARQRARRKARRDPLRHGLWVRAKVNHEGTGIAPDRAAHDSIKLGHRRHMFSSGGAFAISMQLKEIVRAVRNEQNRRGTGCLGAYMATASQMSAVALSR